METLGQRIKRLRTTRNLSQRALGEACGWTESSQARVGNYERGDREPNLADLRTLATILGISLMDLIEGDGSTSSNGDSPTTQDYALIPQYTAKGAAGTGELNEHVEVKGGLVFKRDWLARMRLKEQHLRVIYAKGNSMEPTIRDGNVLLLDESQTEPRNRDVFAIIRPNGELIIKRLIQGTTGGWIIRSDNEDKRNYPDEAATDSEIGHLTIAGKIVWHGGAL